MPGRPKLKRVKHAFESQDAKYPSQRLKVPKTVRCEQVPTAWVYGEVKEIDVDERKVKDGEVEEGEAKEGEVEEGEAEE
ncbi:unnamed protein product [Lactuca virosa]|uniref:Uncharacterized protein n=1 Tax=Lactuca virosa TaxID=75947 RepID=A0AAU9LBC9_9ASTR|nr:unnamed protein product [Lactuca virosa]